MYLDEFVAYLKNERRKSENTQIAYRRDISGFSDFEEKKGISDLKTISNSDIVSYMFELKDSGKSASTINRKMASIRVFFEFLTEKNIISRNPALGIRAPRVTKNRDLEFLSVEEVEMLLDSPEKDSPKGIRDRAILELMYATGIRVNEVTETDVEDINLRIGFFTSNGRAGKARIIPIGHPAQNALKLYLDATRNEMVRGDEEEKALFVNFSGKRMTRQGLWKILKDYGVKTGLGNRLTPRTLRNSFAVHMLQNGADLKSMQELLGHEDIMATQVYLSVTKNRIKDVYDRTHPRA